MTDSFGCLLLFLIGTMVVVVVVLPQLKCSCITEVPARDAQLLLVQQVGRKHRV
jgi:hypothetical protein